MPKKSAKNEQSVLIVPLLANLDVPPTSSTTPLQPALDYASPPRTSKAPPSKSKLHHPHTENSTCWHDLCQGILHTLPTFTKLSYHLGGEALKNNMLHTSLNGWHFVVRGRLAVISHSYAKLSNFSCSYLTNSSVILPSILHGLFCLHSL